MLHLYCNSPKHDERMAGANYPTIQFQYAGHNARECFKQANSDGWLVYKIRGEAFCKICKVASMINEIRK